MTLYFLLGIVFGILISMVWFMYILSNNREAKEAFSKSVKSAKEVVFKEKAEIFDPISPEVEAFEEVVKENEKKGRDTELSGL